MICNEAAKNKTSFKMTKYIITFIPFTTKTFNEIKKQTVVIIADNIEDAKFICCQKFLVWRFV